MLLSMQSFSNKNNPIDYIRINYNNTIELEEILDINKLEQNEFYDTNKLIINNLISTWYKIIKSIDNIKSINVDFICEIHTYVMCNLLDMRQLGHLRNQPVTLYRLDYVPKKILNKHKISDDIYNILYENDEADIIDKILRLYIYLIREQLFIDGNKRTAFMVTNFLLIQNKVGILEYNKENYKKFLKNLYNYLEYNLDEESFISIIKSNYIKYYN